MTSTQSKPELQESRSQGAWIATAEEFEQLGGEWMELFTAAERQCVFLSFEWMFTWWRHWGKNRRLAIVTVRDAQGRLIGLAPFYIARTGPAGVGRRLSFLADTHVGSDYLGVLAMPGCEEAVVEGIVSALCSHRREWDYIELRDAEDSPLFATLCARLEAMGMMARKTAASVCRYIRLPASFDQYLAGIGISLRSNFRRRWRVLQRMGPAEFVALSEVSDLERHFPELISLHGMRFEQRDQNSAFLRPGVPEFHAKALQALAARGWARLYLLRAGGQTVAALYGFSVGRTFQFYQCGTHPGWLHLGVGQLMVGHSIQEAIRTGHQDFDFLRGDESYKVYWAEQSRQTVTVRFFDRRTASRAARAALDANLLLQRAKRRIKMAAGRFCRVPRTSAPSHD
jgi:CelD/BcsL family acetyltransferase involved in cellulose biosynthesis